MLFLPKSIAGKCIRSKLIRKICRDVVEKADLICLFPPPKSNSQIFRRAGFAIYHFPPVLIWNVLSWIVDNNDEACASRNQVVVELENFECWVRADAFFSSEQVGWFRVGGGGEIYFFVSMSE